MMNAGLTDGVDILERETVFDDHVALERVVYRQRAFDGTWFDVCAQHVCRGGPFPLCAGVLPYDPEQDVVVLVEQFRLPAYLLAPELGWTLEIIAGRCEEPESETFVQTAHRELQEEAGQTARHLERVGTLLDSPGSLTQAIEMFVADVRLRGEDGQHHGVAGEQESTRVHFIPALKAVELADSGVIKDGKTLFMLNWLARHRESLRTRWRGDAANG